MRRLKRAAFTAAPKDLADHPACAAAMLVTACRLTECDDIHIGCCVTPSSVVVPVALMAGHMAGASQDRVLEGMLAGYQAMLTLGLAARGAEIIYRGVWPTYLTGGIGAAAIAAKVMGLGERQDPRRHGDRGGSSRLPRRPPATSRKNRRRDGSCSRPRCRAGYWRRPPPQAACTATRRSSPRCRPFGPATPSRCTAASGTGSAAAGRPHRLQALCTSRQGSFGDRGFSSWPCARKR